MRFLLIFILILGCSKAVLRNPAAFDVANPVYDSGTSFADPAVLFAEDGWYYAYATQSRVKGKEENVQAARSKDLRKWERLPDAMPVKPVWANKRQNFWAPHVSLFDGIYVMYVSAEQNEGGYCIAAGTSKDPSGPFKNFKRVVCGKSFENIDPMAFADPVTGRKFLYWGSASEPLKGQELSPDGLSLKAGSKKVDVLKNKREPRGTVTTPDGWTYAFGTQLGPEYENRSNVQAMRTRDFLNWEKLPDAVPERPSWATGTPDHWAPQVVQRGKRFDIYLTFQRGNLSCISVGSSKKTAGPFENFKSLGCSKDFKLVNPLLHQDPQSGKELLAWEDPTWKKLVHRELDRSGKRFAPHSSFVSEELMSSRYRFRRTGYEDLVEGAWVTYVNGYYYLYYSGDECCSQEAHYAVSVARSKDPLGPFVKKGVILKGDSNWLGPGHNSVIADHRGDEWIVYHAIPAKKSKLAVTEDETEVNRLMLIDRIVYDKDGWPRIP
jgi:arabinan endo-1,5-alpha-L-arabinosidase